jgi:hypothetical integral membrane protein (TIGR02206 family)
MRRLHNFVVISPLQREAILPSPFVLFGPSHIAVIASAFAIPAVLAVLVRTLHADDRAVRWTFAAMLIGNWVFWYGLFWQRGWLTWGDALPMNLCDWANIATIAALLRPNQKSYELAYFWTLAGTLQGLMTPDTPYDFPEARFIIFSIFHAGLIAAVLYLTFGTRLRPYLSSLPRIIMWSLIYAAVAGAVDYALGTNYGFLRAKPDHVSLFDFMPDWPRYIPVLIALGLLSACIYYAPWLITDLARKVTSRRASRLSAPGRDR